MLHEAQLSDQQYKTIARYLNLNIPLREKSTTGGHVLNISSVKCAMESSGVRLHRDAITKTVLYPARGVIDLTDCSDDIDSATDAPTSIYPSEEGVQCVYVTDPMETLVRPELEDVFKLFPACAEAIMAPQASDWKTGLEPCLDIVLHLDNTCLETETGKTEAYECGVMRFILPGVPTPQQSHFSCIPLFVLAGDEK